MYGLDIQLFQLTIAVSGQQSLHYSLHSVYLRATYALLEPSA